MPWLDGHWQHNEQLKLLSRFADIGTTNGRTLGVDELSSVKLQPV
jgi:hypothetical protein